VATVESKEPIARQPQPLVGTESTEVSTTTSTVWPVATRYRCTACGNLTRFDVTTTRTTRAFHHFTVGGELQVEDEEVLADSVDEVSCRWCGHGRSVEAVPSGTEATAVGPESSRGNDASGPHQSAVH